VVHPRLCGLELVVKVVVKYDHEILMPLLLFFFYNTLTLASIIVEPTKSITLELDVLIFLASTKKVTLELFKIELSF